MNKIYTDFKDSTHEKKIVLLFLYLLPLIDMSNKIFSNSTFGFSVIIKGVFTFYLVVKLLHINVKKYLLFFSSLAFIVVVQSSIFEFSIRYLLLNSIGLFKYSYFYIILLYLLELKKKGELIHSNYIFKVWFYLISSSFIVSHITNSYNQTYSWIFSSKSWYYAGNELSSFLMALFPFVIINLNYKKISSLVYTLTMVVLISSFMGTKTLYFGTFLFLLIFLLYQLILRFKQKKFQTINQSSAIIVIFISILSMIIIYPLSPVGSQIKDHANIIERDIVRNPDPIDNKLETSNIDDENNSETVKDQKDENESIKESEIDSQKTTDENEPLETVEETNADSDNYYPDILKEYPKLNVLNMILKNRVVKVIQIGEVFMSKTPYSLLVGIGTEVSISGNNLLVQTEMDFFTIFFRYGIGSLVLLFILIYYFLKIFYEVFLTNRNKRFESLTYLYSFLILIAAAFIAGHVLIAPLVNIIIPVLFIGIINIKDEY